MRQKKIYYKGLHSSGEISGSVFINVPKRIEILSAFSRSVTWSKRNGIDRRICREVISDNESNGEGYGYMRMVEACDVDCDTQININPTVPFGSGVEAHMAEYQKQLNKIPKRKYIGKILIK